VHDHGHTHDHHGHGHGHGGHAHHHHAPPAGTRGFSLAIWLNAGFVVLEAVAGILFDSLSLLADAGHNLTDVGALALAWLAARLAQQPRRRRHTYGLRRGTILAALANALLVFATVGAIAVEAATRFSDPAQLSELPVMVVAAVGIGINFATALLFMQGRESDANRRGAYLHMMADAGVSLGVVVSAGAIWATGWQWLDPLTALLVCAVIAYASWGLLRETLDLSLDAVPQGIDPDAVEGHLRNLPGVSDLHDLHIWALSTTETALTVHLVRPDSRDDDGFLVALSDELKSRFGIVHSTVQIERSTEVDCDLATSRV